MCLYTNVLIDAETFFSNLYCPIFVQLKTQVLNHFTMIRFLQLATVSLLLFSCGQTNKEEAQESQEKTPQAETSERAEDTIASTDQGNEYKVVFRKIDNRVLLHVDDSLIYDSGTVGGNPDLEIEIFLTKYVEMGKNEILIHGYNGVEPYNQADSHWELVYDIYINDQIVDFVREANDKGDVGKVFEEVHFLNELE